MNSAPFCTPLDLRALRQSTGLNQADFWNRVEVTQSGGSRYESNRAVPPQVAELVRLFYCEGIDTSLITGEVAKSVKAVVNGEAVEASLQAKRLELAEIEARIDRLKDLLKSA